MQEAAPVEPHQKDDESKSSQSHYAPSDTYLVTWYVRPACCAIEILPFLRKGYVACDHPSR